jgi:hypothetical protein
VSMFLTEAELEDLTHRKYGAWQARVLDSMEIRYRRRPDGSLAVLRSDVEGKQDARRAPQLRAG